MGSKSAWKGALSAQSLNHTDSISTPTLRFRVYEAARALMRLARPPAGTNSIFFILQTFFLFAKITQSRGKMAYSDRYFSLEGALQEYFPRSDILHSFQLSLLTVCIPQARSESIRMNRRPSHRHLSDTERGQKRPCKPMRHAFLTGKQKPTGICTPPDTRLSTDLQTFRKPTIHDSEPDANICNRGCKYLQVRLQTFASGNSSIHRHEKMPSPYPIFMFTGPHT